MHTTLSGVHIHSIMAGIAENPCTLQELFGDAIDEKEAKRLKRGTGFSKLRIAKKGVITSDFCVAAAERLMEKEDIDRTSIDGLILVTQTPDYICPATSHVMQNRLRLRNDIVAMDLIQGCSGYVYGLYMAALQVSSGNCNRVLLCVGDSDGAGELSAGEKSTAVLFGSGAAVTLVEKSEESISFGIKTYGERYQMLITKRSGWRYPYVSSYDPAATPEILAENHSHMDGMGIMEFSLNDVPHDIKEFLDYMHVEAQSIDLFAVHQSNRMIVRSLADLLGVPYEKIPFTAGEIGNLSSASIPVLLSMYSNPQPLQRTCLCGYGIGLSVACALVDLSNTKFCGAVEL